MFRSRMMPFIKETEIVKYDRTFHIINNVVGVLGSIGLFAYAYRESQREKMRAMQEWEKLNPGKQGERMQGNVPIDTIQAQEERNRPSSNKNF